MFFNLPGFCVRSATLTPSVSFPGNIFTIHVWYDQNLILHCKFTLFDSNLNYMPILSPWTNKGLYEFKYFSTFLVISVSGVTWTPSVSFSGKILTKEISYDQYLIPHSMFTLFDSNINYMPNHSPWTNKGVYEFKYFSTFLVIMSGGSLEHLLFPFWGKSSPYMSHMTKILSQTVCLLYLIAI